MDNQLNTQPPSHLDAHVPDKRLDFILHTIIEEADLLAIVLYGKSVDSTTLDVIAACSNDTSYIPWPELLETLSTVFKSTKDRANPRYKDITLQAQAHKILMRPLIMMGQIIGMMALVTGDDAEIPASIRNSIEPKILLAQTILEHTHLTERLLVTEAIGVIAQKIASNPQPQNIVNTLRTYLHEDDIIAYAIGIFGPIKDDATDTETEYIDVLGGWTRDKGNIDIQGNRIYVHPYQAQLDEICQQRISIFIDPEIIAANKFLQELLDAPQMQSVTIMTLQSNHHRIGLLALASDQPESLSEHTLRTYQIITEFLAMSTIASNLQKQAQLIQHGRSALLDAVTDGVIMVLPDERATIAIANEQFYRMLEIDPGPVENRSLCEILPKYPVTYTVYRELLDNWKTFGPNSMETRRGEFMITRSSGSSADIQWYSAPVHKQEKVIGRIYTFHDISSERSSERLRSQLLSRISHELRTPLTSIRGFAEFILEAEGEKLSPLASEYLSIIVKSAIHLNRIFSDLIEITRANVGEARLVRVNARLQNIISEAVKSLEPQLKTKNQRITLNQDEDIPSMHVDVDRIQQIVANLINNASKYAPKDTLISIRTSYCKSRSQLSHFAPDDMLVPCCIVEVSDEGFGLSQDEARRIFLPFYRTEEARTKKIEGAGLGLAIVTSFVTLHRGSIWVEPSSKERPGGHFFFSIPIYGDGE